MPHIPQTFSITLKHQYPAGDDADRLVQIGGEGVIAARWAIAALDEVGDEIDRVNPKLFSDLRMMIEKRDIFTSRFRNLVEDAVVIIDGYRVANGEDPEARDARDRLAEAVERIERVADYMAADLAIKSWNRRDRV